jgi:hypothetical protein
MNSNTIHDSDALEMEKNLRLIEVRGFSLKLSAGFGLFVLGALMSALVFFAPPDLGKTTGRFDANLIVPALGPLFLIVGICLIIMTIVTAIRRKIFRRIGEASFGDDQGVMQLIIDSFKEIKADGGEEFDKLVKAKAGAGEAGSDTGEAADEEDEDRRLIGRRHGVFERLELEGKDNKGMPNIKGPVDW